MTNLVASLIVRNEEQVIARCIHSISPYVKEIIISDTGSVDNTIKVAKTAADQANIPLTVWEDKWINFAHNRNLVLQRSPSAYILFIDADEVMEDADELLNLAECDGIKGKNIFPDMEYERIRIIKNDGSWKWVGAVHEVIVSDKQNPKLVSSKIKFYDKGDGARSRSGIKLYQDVMILEQENKNNPNDSRTTFYLARTYDDLGMSGRAIQKYQQRIAIGGWAEEVYYSLFCLAKLKYQNSFDVFSCIDDFMNAVIYRPCRLEALVFLCEKLRERKSWGLILALTEGKNLIKNEDALFVDKRAEWRVVEERALAYYYIGNKIQAKNNYELILHYYSLNQVDMDRIQNSLSYC